MPSPLRDPTKTGQGVALGVHEHQEMINAMWLLFMSSAFAGLRRARHSLAISMAGIMAVGLLVFTPLFAPFAASAAETTGNWFLDDGSGHTLGAMLFERSDVNTPSGLRLRLNAESSPLRLDHARPLVLTDENQQAWSLANRSEELLINDDGAIPPASAQYDAGCLNPIPDDGVTMQIMVPSSAGDLSFDLEPGQVQTLHSLTAACAG